MESQYEQEKALLEGEHQLASERSYKVQLPLRDKSLIPQAQQELRNQLTRASSELEQARGSIADLQTVATARQQEAKHKEAKGTPQKCI